MRKGQKMSAESREKMRLAKLGRPSNNQNRGYKKPQSPETRAKISKSMLGENNHRWKGGISNVNYRIRRTAKYRQWRDSIYERDNWTCQNCNKRGYSLQAHHIVPFAELVHKNNITCTEQAMECSEMWLLENGITLCEDCHKKTDSYLKPFVPENIYN